MTPRARFLLLASIIALGGPAGGRALPSPDLLERANAQAPFLAVSGERACAVWFEGRGGVHHALRFWGERASSAGADVRTVLESDSFLVNGADTPVLLATPGGRLAISYPWRSASAYGYDVRVVLSTDGGRTWSRPITPHRDGTPTQHGFVSMTGGPDGIRLFWLDGRKTAGRDEGEGDMSLRTARLGWNRALGAAAELDGRVCDCCPTSAVETPGGTLIAYRDRSPEETRDIALIRGSSRGWGAPEPLHRDGWTIAGCPVNGPALDAAGRNVAVAWFTGAGDSARVFAAISRDGGRRFGGPIRVDGGDPLGRVDVVALDDGTALVSWLERRGEDAALCLRRVGRSGEGTREVARVSAGRESGIPRLARTARGAVVLAWTEGARPNTSVRVRRVSSD